MCGIAGQIYLDDNESNEIIDEQKIEKMLQIIRHRGPDGQGIYLSSHVAFGMRRLSIIDLERGWQPIYNEDQSIVCCCNGEIYNYLELREKLISNGHVFKTNSDCEVIVHLYEEKGTEFVEQLNGMFAICIWDIKERKLLLYRDRLGKKPLYYSVYNKKLYFASEIKCILACGEIPRISNKEALDYIMTYNYIPNNLTAFEHIYKLMAGEYMIIKDGEWIIKKYWNLPALQYNPYSYNEKDVIDELDTLLDDSIKIRLRSDVPIGAFLSGGIDSGIVVAKAAKIKTSLETFSIGFEEEKYNELSYAEKISQLIHSRQHSEIVSPDFFKLLPKTIWLNDEPHGDVSFLPTYILSQMTSKYVKTVLTGDGGDELFGGYDKYKGFIKQNQISYQEFYENTSVFSSNEKSKLYSDDLKKRLDLQSSSKYPETLIKKICNVNQLDKVDRLNALLYLETSMLLDGNNLVKPDRMGMGNSIEARMPLLDYRLVEYVSKLPSNLKIKNGETKYILKKLAEGYLPKEIVYREKQMFTVPIGEWLKGKLKPIAYKILMDKRTTDRNLFKMEYVKQMLDLHTNGAANYTRQLRLLIIIELWHRIYIDNFYFREPEIEEII